MICGLIGKGPTLTAFSFSSEIPLSTTSIGMYGVEVVGNINGGGDIDVAQDSVSFESL